MLTSTGIIREKIFSDLGKEVVLNVNNNLFGSIRFPSFFYSETFGSCYSLLFEIFSSVSCFSILSWIIPLQILGVLCSVTVTFRLKNFVIFKRFSD